MVLLSNPANCIVLLNLSIASDALNDSLTNDPISPVTLVIAPAAKFASAIALNVPPIF